MIWKSTLVTSIVLVLAWPGLTEAQGMKGFGKSGGMMGGGCCCAKGSGMMGGGTPGMTATGDPTTQLQLYQAMLQLQLSQVALRQQLLSGSPMMKSKQPITKKDSPDPVLKAISRDNPTLVRSPGEKEQLAQETLNRGIKAEQEGNLLLAAVCYCNAFDLYPDTSIATQARAAHDRVEADRARQIKRK